MRVSKRSLFLLMNDKLVGHLEKTSGGNLSFSYDQMWLDTPGARPISLSMPLISKKFTGDVVYNFFDNLLPDNLQVRAAIQARFKISTSHPFDLLAKIGKDCVGAIQLLEEFSGDVETNIEFALVSEQEIAKILRNIQKFPLGMIEENSNEFRISIAGAQEKTAFLKWREKWCRPIGSTPTTHIFKLPIGSHQNLDLRDSCENEWICAQIIAAFGLPVAKCEIMDFEEIKTLVVERFDRKTSSDRKKILRLPQEDFCQVLGVSPNLKYQADGGPGIQEVMKILLGSSEPLHDQKIFFSAQIIFWMLAAIDGHAKNFSLFLKPDGSYSLTPLYDIMSVYPLIKTNQLQSQKIKMAMALKSNKNHYLWHKFQRRHFFSMAKTANYSVEKTEEILNEILSKVENVIAEVSKKLPRNFPNNISEPIFLGLLDIKKALSKL